MNTFTSDIEIKPFPLFFSNEPAKAKCNLLIIPLSIRKSVPYNFQENRKMSTYYIYIYIHLRPLPPS